MANTLKIKRSTITNIPNALAEGELAYSYTSDKLFVGDHLANVRTIGGKSYVDKLDLITVTSPVNLNDLDVSDANWTGDDLSVVNGGTGRSTGGTAYGLIAAGTTATGAHQTLPAGATTELLVGGGASALPVWTAATGTGSPVRATSPTLVTPVLGTPSSGTLTNCTGLPVSGITASTTTAIGVGSIELGHASDTTITRVSAGNIAVEGNTIYRAGGTDVALADGGTGASLTDPNADMIMFWDDSANVVTWLTPSTGLTLNGTDLTVRTSSDSQTGIVELATSAETQTGTDTARAVTPAGFKTAGNALYVQLINLTGNRNVTRIVATAGQTVFTVPSYLVGYDELDVYVNGVFQKVAINYTETNSTTITLTEGTTLNDIVDIRRTVSFGTANPSYLGASAQAVNSAALNGQPSTYYTNADNLNSGSVKIIPTTGERTNWNTVYNWYSSMTTVDADAFINTISEVLNAFSGAAESLNLASELANPTNMTFDAGTF